MINQTRGPAQQQLGQGRGGEEYREKEEGRVEPDSRGVRSTFVAARRKAKAEWWIEATVEISRWMPSSGRKRLIYIPDYMKDAPRRSR